MRPAAIPARPQDRPALGRRLKKAARRDLPLWILAVPGLTALIVFSYFPIYGLIIAFQDYSPGLGFLGSPWVGFKHFARLFRDPYFVRTFRNTVILGVYTLVFTFPAPLLFALLLNELRSRWFKKAVQTVSYLPNFISVVIVVGFLIDFTSLSDGVVNDVIAFFGGERIHFMAEPKWFRFLYVVSDIWQGVGVGSIIYLAAIAGIGVELYESAYLDGATKLQQMRYITLPCLMPTIAILLILQVGELFGADFQKIMLMYSPLTYETADVISTYVYRSGVRGGALSYSTAVGFFLSVISFLFVFAADRISNRISDISVF